MIELDKTSLFKWLHAENEQLAARIQDLRTAVGRWLTYVPATFPHYTIHSVEHSDAIVVELSHLLTSNDEPSVPLNEMEIYILLCAVYLHDIGMVAADAEKAEVLESPEWTAFVKD